MRLIEHLELIKTREFKREFIFFGSALVPSSVSSSIFLLNRWIWKQIVSVLLLLKIFPENLGPIKMITSII